ncbi:MAG TPA: HAMP domain-containing sensor histidine kinase [Alphaproteobacteria bacterium]|nr:HAMP domain-containing sensor histidine kinase [Alphaproteobacteria bacterium]
MAEAAAAAIRRGVVWFLRSLALRLLVLVIVFAAVPALIYQQFRAADEEKQALILESAQRQGQLIASALTAGLTTAENGIPTGLSDTLERLSDGKTRIKLLLLPSRATGVSGFYYVAAAPTVPRAFLDLERDELINRGILEKLAETCAGGLPLALRLETEGGREEVLTSITPIKTAFGCWAVITSQSTGAILGTSIGQPYWNTPEMRIAALIYLAMAALVLAIFGDIWHNLRRFGGLARQIDVRGNGAATFAEQNKVPELDSVAQDFDRLVARLRQSTENIRRAAEDNAHAFKTPIGVIRQSIEPLKKLAGADRRGGIALDMIEKATNRLDTLVSTARQMDEATADLVDPAMSEIDLSTLIRRMADGVASIYTTRMIKLETSIEPNLKVRGSEDVIETIVENILDNAHSFSSPGDDVTIGLKRNGASAELSIRDRGPGVEPAKLERIFDRYFSDRPELAATVNGTSVPEGHFGIGLWIVRENVAALGGRVTAENNEGRGLTVRVILPLAR